MCSSGLTCCFIGCIHRLCVLCWQEEVHPHVNDLSARWFRLVFFGENTHDSPGDHSPTTSTSLAKTATNTASPSVSVALLSPLLSYPFSCAGMVVVGKQTDSPNRLVTKGAWRAAGLTRRPPARGSSPTALSRALPSCSRSSMPSPTRCATWMPSTLSTGGSVCVCMFVCVCVHVYTLPSMCRG